MNITIVGRPKDAESIPARLKRAVLAEYGKERGGVPKEVLVTIQEPKKTAGDSDLVVTISERGVQDWFFTNAETACRRFFKRIGVKKISFHLG